MRKAYILLLKMIVQIKKSRIFAPNFKTQVINIFLYEKNLIKYCNCRCSDNKC